MSVDAQPPYRTSSCYEWMSTELPYYHQVVIPTSIGILLFWCYLYFVFFKEHLAKLGYSMTESPYTSRFYALFTGLLHAPNLFLDDFNCLGLNTPLGVYYIFFQALQLWNTVWYNIVDMLYFKPGKTPRIWLIHHTIASLSCFACNYMAFTVLASKMISVIEIGSFFFMLNKLYGIKKNTSVAFVCISIIIITRIYMTAKFCQGVYYMYQLWSWSTWVENGASVIWVSCAAIAIAVNYYFIERNCVAFMKHHVYGPEKWNAIYGKKKSRKVSDQKKEK